MTKNIGIILVITIALCCFINPTGANAKPKKQKPHPPQKNHPQKVVPASSFAIQKPRASKPIINLNKPVLQVKINQPFLPPKSKAEKPATPDIIAKPSFSPIRFKPQTETQIKASRPVSANILLPVKPDTKSDVQKSTGHSVGLHEATVLPSALAGFGAEQLDSSLITSNSTTLQLITPKSSGSVSQGNTWLVVNDVLAEEEDDNSLQNEKTILTNNINTIREQKPTQDLANRSRLSRPAIPVVSIPRAVVFNSNIITLENVNLIMPAAGGQKEYREDEEEELNLGEKEFESQQEQDI